MCSRSHQSGWKWQSLDSNPDAPEPSISFLAHTDPIAQPLGPPQTMTGSKASPRLGPQHSPEHSCLKQNLASPLGLINYRPISRVALSAIMAAAYLLIAQSINTFDIFNWNQAPQALPAVEL